MNLREVGLGPEGQVVCWEGQWESPLSEIRPPRWQSLGVWVGPPCTPARQNGRAPDGAVGQRGRQTIATAPPLSVRKDVFMGVTDVPGPWWVSRWLYCEILRTTGAAKH